MSIREFLGALRSTQGQHALAAVLEGPESGERLLLCEGVPVWPARPEGLLARNLPALAGCGASGILTLENKRIFVEKFGGAPRLVICGGGHVAESVVRLAVMLGLPVTGLEERPEYADALRRAGAENVLCGPYAENLTRVEGSAETYFVVATRAHSFDVECLTEIYRKRFAYVGMLGSRSRSALVRRQLIEAGAAPEKAESLHAPIGLAIKAQTAHEHTGLAALADDSGLIVDALGGEPGVFSARYAGVHGDDAANNAKVLVGLEGVVDDRRTARFACALVFIDEDGTRTDAMGFIEGRIGHELRGSEGFGYDPLFLPDAFGWKKTLAEVEQDEQNEISHRGYALRSLKAKLQAGLQ